jgi:molybdenum cofactor cytidylyltransferase
VITAGVLLAAGVSQRFGADSKLLARYRGRPLITHAAGALRDAGLDILIGVVADEDVAAELDGFHLAWMRTDNPSQSRSLRAGIAAARERDADHALIALADMPAMTPGHLAAVASRCTGHTPAATSNGSRAMVPACFPRQSFDALMALEGDTGARSLLAGLPDDALVYADESLLLDIDSPARLFANR